MNIQINETLIKRNARIGQITMLSGLLVLAGGMYVSFRMPTQVPLSLGALMVGFILSQVGIYFSNRWGRRPRPDELLNQALKGLDKNHTIFHYRKLASHLLVGPTGIWVLLPYYQRGKITYQNGRWRQRGGNVLLAYLKLFAQEGIGRPDLEMAAETGAVRKFLKEIFPEDEKIPEVQAALVFTNPSVEIDIPEDINTPAETVTLSKLKDVIRKKAKGNSLSAEKTRQIQEALLSA